MNNNNLVILMLLLTLLTYSSCRKRVEYVQQQPPVEVSAPDSVVYYSPDNPDKEMPDSNLIAKMQNPLLLTKENLDKGKQLFERYCKHCHGKTGLSDAPMIVKEKYPPPPKYKDKVPALTEGQLFNIIWFGKNLMPPNNNELSQEEVWSLALYVRQLSKTEEDKE